MVVKLKRIPPPDELPIERVTASCNITSDDDIIATPNTDEVRIEIRAKYPARAVSLTADDAEEFGKRLIELAKQVRRA